MTCPNWWWWYALISAHLIFFAASGKLFLSRSGIQSHSYEYVHIIILYGSKIFYFIVILYLDYAFFRRFCSQLFWNLVPCWHESGHQGWGDQLNQVSHVNRKVLYFNIATQQMELSTSQIMTTENIIGSFTWRFISYTKNMWRVKWEIGKALPP
jgi:hypothetical protein